MQAKTLAPYVLRFLALNQINSRRTTLETLVDELKVRRADLRQTISALEAEGHLDSLHMRLTLTGFALGVGLVDVELASLRQPRRPKMVAIAA
jgi:hypothetical protein